VQGVLGTGTKDSPDEGAHKKKKKGAFAGVFVPTCENMWGVLIFLRFYFVAGQAGIMHSLIAVFLSFCAAFCTTSSMSAIVSSGGIVSKGGPYYMISRALGPVVGASVGVMYFLAITLLAVLETLGAVECLLMAAPSLDFGWATKSVYGSVTLVMLVSFVWGGINFVTKLGIFFVFIVFYTLFSYYFGLLTTPDTPLMDPLDNPWVTGLSWEMFKQNWGPHYDDQTSFGVVLSVFFPCFTGILSGANRADILRDPPKNIKEGTFGAIIFSFFMYSSFFILWGMVADYRYLQGFIYQDEACPGGQGCGQGRRLAGGIMGAHIVEEIVWNPFPHSAHIGIIISSLSQALQCLIVAPKLLQAIANDRILSLLTPLAPLSKSGEPVRALLGTYVIAGLLVLIGDVNAVAPLLTMCFLVAYAFMNFSCFVLTWLKSTGFRPKGVHKKRFRFWYMGTGLLGFAVCLSIMFIVNPIWAGVALLASLSLYMYINYKLESHEWGSAMDGIRFQLALHSLIQLEDSQHQTVNWRPNILILYRIHLSEELKGIKHHEILNFYSQLRKGNGFCVVACVLEGKRDEHSLHKAKIEKGVIQNIMKEEAIQGFAEVVVAPSWSEGTNYIIQLTGIGGIVPNTVLMDWPVGWREKIKKAQEFVNVLSIAQAADKAVLAVKGLNAFPTSAVHGTIDIWWVIHDGGFLILLCWLLVQHRVWRSCHLRVFTITEGVTAEQAKLAATFLTRTLRQRRLFDVDVEVILADDEMIEPYTYDWTLRVEERNKFMEQLNNQRGKAPAISKDLPQQIDELFTTQVSGGTEGSFWSSISPGDQEAGKDEHDGNVVVSDVRRGTEGNGRSSSSGGRRHSRSSSKKAASAEKPATTSTLALGEEVITAGGDGSGVQAPKAPCEPDANLAAVDEAEPDVERDVDAPAPPAVPTTPSSALQAALTATGGGPSVSAEQVDAFKRLNQIIVTRSKRAQLVVMNLPDLWGQEESQVVKYMTYCETLTSDLERVLFVHSTGHEVFDIST